MGQYLFDRKSDRNQIAYNTCTSCFRSFSSSPGAVFKLLISTFCMLGGMFYIACLSSCSCSCGRAIPGNLPSTRGILRRDADRENGYRVNQPSSATPSTLSLLTRLHEPEPFVYASCDLGEDVSRIGVLQFGRLLAGVAFTGSTRSTSGDPYFVQTIVFICFSEIVRVYC